MITLEKEKIEEKEIDRYAEIGLIILSKEITRKSYIDWIIESI